jgi:plastocyanin
MKRRTTPHPARIAGRLSAVVLAALLLSPAAGMAQEATVKIDNFTFDPPRLTVKSGTTVTWYN